MNFQTNGLRSRAHLATTPVLSAVEAGARRTPTRGSCVESIATNNRSTPAIGAVGTERTKVVLGSYTAVVAVTVLRIAAGVVTGSRCCRDSLVVPRALGVRTIAVSKRKVARRICCCWSAHSVGARIRFSNGRPRDGAETKM